MHFIQESTCSFWHRPSVRCSKCLERCNHHVLSWSYVHCSVGLRRVDSDVADYTRHSIPKISDIFPGRCMQTWMCGLKRAVNTPGAPRLQEFLRVCMMDGTFTTMPMTENTKCRDVIRYMSKKHGLNNETEYVQLDVPSQAFSPRGLFLLQKVGTLGDMGSPRSSWRSF